MLNVDETELWESYAKICAKEITGEIRNSVDMGQNIADQWTMKPRNS